MALCRENSGDHRTQIAQNIPDLTKEAPSVGLFFYALSDFHMTISDYFIGIYTQSGDVIILSENLLKFALGVPLFLVDHTRSNTCVFLTPQQSRPSPSD